MKKTVIDRIRGRCLIDHVTGCWNWQGFKRNGYGWINLRGKNMSASRAIMIETTGLNEGNKEMLACHKCNNRACCNPDHIYWGTKKTNAQDMVKAGNHNWHKYPKKLDNHPSSKLTLKKIMEIWDIRKKTGWGALKISRHLGLNKNTVNNILYDKNRHGHKVMMEGLLHYQTNDTTQL